MTLVATRQCFWNLCLFFPKKKEMGRAWTWLWIFRSLSISSVGDGHESGPARLVQHTPGRVTLTYS